MWRGLVEWASATMLRPGFELASSRDMQIPRCVENAADAVAVIRDHHARWLTAQGKSSEVGCARWAVKAGLLEVGGRHFGREHSLM